MTTIEGGSNRFIMPLFLMMHAVDTGIDFRTSRGHALIAKMEKHRSRLEKLIKYLRIRISMI